MTTAREILQQLNEQMGTKRHKKYPVTLLGHDQNGNNISVLGYAYKKKNNFIYVDRLGFDYNPNEPSFTHQRVIERFVISSTIGYHSLSPIFVNKEDKQAILKDHKQGKSLVDISREPYIWLGHRTVEVYPIKKEPT